jgi:quercetin dioxygenase-like cupin family protein
LKPRPPEPITLQRGEAAHAPRDVVHAARNGSDSEPVKVLVHIVMDKGKPLAEAVD